MQVFLKHAIQHFQNIFFLVITVLPQLLQLLSKLQIVAPIYKKIMLIKAKFANLFY